MYYLKYQGCSEASSLLLGDQNRTMDHNSFVGCYFFNLNDQSLLVGGYCTNTATMSGAFPRYRQEVSVHRLFIISTKSVRQPKVEQTMLAES
jgi:hypothetical protein